MIDIKIKNLTKVLTSDKKIKEFFNDEYVITEKFDGTKLTITRNSVEFDKRNYSNNWIISYKGNVILRDEIDNIKLKSVRDHSIGISQYALVHEHMRRIHKKTEQIPTNTEFFIEFIMRKPTLTRKYKIYHSLVFLKCERVIFTTDDLEYVSSSGSQVFGKISPFEQLQFANTLNLHSLPILYEGKLHYNKLDWRKSLDSIIDTFTSFESIFGGTPEGVVLRSINNQYKIVQLDQYDRRTRDIIKNQWRMADVEETEYWDKVYQLSSNWVSLVKKNNPDYNVRCMLRELSDNIYSRRPKVLHTKKKVINRQDDIYLTSKIMIKKLLDIGINTKTLGLIPMAAKPLHKGHWSLIEKASRECDKVIIFTSTISREFMSIKSVNAMWAIIKPNLPENVSVRVVASPINSVNRELAYYDIVGKSPIPEIHVYGGNKDANVWRNVVKQNVKLTNNDKIFVHLLDTNIVNISGSQMREFVRLNDKVSFIDGLPKGFSDKCKIDIWNLLYNLEEK